MNLLVLGGEPDERLRVVGAFHATSPFRAGPLVRLECAREEAGLIAALRARLAGSSEDPIGSPLRAGEHGTLFLDAVGSLSPAAQRLLLEFARSLSDPSTVQTLWIGRLATGDGYDLDLAVSEERFSAALFDCLDKIRIELATAAQGAA
jgi:DNA-binding NtrC family response regulator